MYLPKSKYRVETVSPGKYTLNGESYAGAVLIDYLGNKYAGDSPNNLKGKLVEATYTDNTKNSDSIVPIKRAVPSPEEYSTGKIERYFRQNIRTGKIDEIAHLPKIQKKSERYRYGTVTWTIKGPLEDTENRIGGGKTSIYKGTRTQNNRAIDELEKTLPGLRSSGMLSDPDEFVKHI